MIRSPGYNGRSDLPLPDPTMTLDPTKRRLSAELPAPVRAMEAGVRVPASEGVLAPLDHFHDRLTTEITEAADDLEAKTHKVPVLGQAVQFLRGAASALAATVEGTYQMVRHPVQTVQGLWTMLSHVPLSPPWVYRAVSAGPGATLAGDGVFWKAVGQGMLEPYRKDWQAGRYYAAAGRAAAEIGMLYFSARQAKKAYDAWQGRRRAGAVVDEVATTSRLTADEGLKAAVMGDDGMRATGSVVGEGEVVVGGQKTVGRVRDELEQARRSFTGDRTELRASVGARAKVDTINARRLDQVGPKRLRSDSLVQRRFRMVTKSVDRRMDAELQQILGFRPEGSPKAPIRAAAKLEDLQALKGPKVRLGDLDDLARGRINLPAHDVKGIRDMVGKLRAHYGDSNLLINDYMRGKPFYRGRIHVKIRDVSGLWYELQIGSKQLSTFFDSPFVLRNKVTNIHDGVYKGLMMLDDEAFKVLGRGNAAAGSKRVARVMNMYVEDLDEVLGVAAKGQPYDALRATNRLREGLREVIDELPPNLLPIGLQ